jgi:hypothetical protein
VCTPAVYRLCVPCQQTIHTYTAHHPGTESTAERQLSTADPCITMPAQFSSLGVHGTVLLTDSYTATRVIKKWYVRLLALAVKSGSKFWLLLATEYWQSAKLFSSRRNWDFPNPSPLHF